MRSRPSFSSFPKRGRHRTTTWTLSSFLPLMVKRRGWGARGDPGGRSRRLETASVVTVRAHECALRGLGSRRCCLCPRAGGSPNRETLLGSGSSTRRVPTRPISFYGCAFTPRGAGRPSRGDTRMKFKSAANAVLSGVKMEKAAAGECVKVRLASARPLADLPLHSFLPSRRSPLERPVWSPGRGAMPPAVRQGDQGGP